MSNNKVNFNNTNYINGPVCLYRLENNGKVLYIFSDYHFYEKKCENEISLDIDDFLVREFENINENKENIYYDFFIEKHPSINSEGNRHSYIDKLKNTFEKFVNFKENKMTISEFGEKVRIHYIDNRDNIIYHIFRMFKYMNNNKINLRNIIEKIKELINFIKNPTYNKYEFTNFLKKDNTYNNDISNSYFQKIIYKMRNMYNNNKIKKIINKYLDIVILELEIVVKELNECYEKLDKFGKYTNENKMYCINNKCQYSYYNTELIDLINNLFFKASNSTYAKFLEATSKIIDLYFIRRFLDKDYVTNGILYSGAFHSCDVIYILVTEFNFKITHTSLNNNFDYNKYIKESKYKEFHKNKWHKLLPEIFTQCIDYSIFPKLFK